MKIKEIISQSRIDFTAIYECEHCGHTFEGSGYAIDENGMCIDVNKHSIVEEQ